MTVLSVLVLLSLLLLWLYFDKFVKLSLAFVINWSFKQLKMARNAARVQEKPHKWAFLSLLEASGVWPVSQWRKNKISDWLQLQKRAGAARPTGKTKDGQSDSLVDDRLHQDVETPQTLKSGIASDPLPVAKRSWPRPARGKNTHCSSESEWHDAQCLASCMADV